MKDKMEARYADLCGDFSALDLALERELNTAVDNVREAYWRQYDTSVQRTIQDWTQRFSRKCPKTFARFTHYFSGDSHVFMDESRPDFIETSGLAGASSQENFLRILAELKAQDESASDEALLEILASDHGAPNPEFGSLKDAKDNLKTLYIGALANTAVLEAVINDEDGANAAYIEIQQVKRFDDR